MMSALKDYRARLESEPLTHNQLGAIHGHFLRLGFHVRYDRAERLRLTAILARSGQIASTKDLTMGQAGRAVGLLTGCRTAPELYAVAEPPPVAARGMLATFRAWLAS